MNSDQANYLAAAIAEDRVVLHTLAAVLINRELERFPDRDQAEKQLSEEIHAAIDRYETSGSTPDHLMEIDRQRGRDVIDALLGLALIVHLAPPKVP